MDPDLLRKISELTEYPFPVNICHACGRKRKAPAKPSCMFCIYRKGRSNAT